MAAITLVPSTEDLNYKQRDHLIRPKDHYANEKYQITKRWLSDYVRPGMRLLNVGCGGGEFNSIAVEMGFKVTGFEPEPEAYKLALRKLPRINCEVRQLDLNSIDSKRYRANVVVMHDVLEHIQDQRSALHKIASLIEPRGRAYITVPALQWLFGYHDLKLGHFRRYSKSGLTKLLSRNFRIRRMRYFGMSFIPATMWYSRIRREEYPIGTRANNSPIANVWRLLCCIETHINVPIGTSVLAEIEPIAGLR
jgi:SAM-dependent methyltransferase